MGITEWPGECERCGKKKILLIDSVGCPDKCEERPESDFVDEDTLEILPHEAHWQPMFYDDDYNPD